MIYAKLIGMGAAIAITAIELFLVVPPAFARAPESATILGEVAAGHVNYGDLDLTSIAGVEALRGRVASAIRKNCAELSDHSSDPFAETRCRTASWRGVEAQISLASQRARELTAKGAVPAGVATSAAKK